MQSWMTKKPFLFALFFNFIWINLSEIFRYFVFVMPMMRKAFPELPHIAPMDFSVFMVWGVWDAILIVIVTLYSALFFKNFGYGVVQTLLAGTVIWLGTFVLFWLALLNMNLATINILLVALPLTWFEMVIASVIVCVCGTKIKS